MEEWRAELAASIQGGLEESDEDEEWEQEVFLEAVALMMEDSIPPPERERYVGSTSGRRYVHRECEVCHERLYHDYFAEYPTYDAQKFRKRFRMRRELFLLIVDRVCTYAPHH